QGVLANGAAGSLDRSAVARARSESGFHNGGRTFEKIRCQRNRAAGTWRNTRSGLVTKLRLKPPSRTEPRRSRRIFVTRRPFGPQLRQLLKPTTCLNHTDIGFRRCVENVTIERRGPAFALARP